MVPPRLSSEDGHSWDMSTAVVSTSKQAWGSPWKIVPSAGKMRFKTGSPEEPIACRQILNTCGAV